MSYGYKKEKSRNHQRMRKNPWKRIRISNLLMFIVFITDKIEEAEGGRTAHYKCSLCVCECVRTRAFAKIIHTNVRIVGQRKNQFDARVCVCAMCIRVLNAERERETKWRACVQFAAYEGINALKMQLCYDDAWKNIILLLRCERIQKVTAK